MDYIINFEMYYLNKNSLILETYNLMFLLLLYIKFLFHFLKNLLKNHKVLIHFQNLIKNYHFLYLYEQYLNFNNNLKPY